MRQEALEMCRQGWSTNKYSAGSPRVWVRPLVSWMHTNAAPRDVGDI